MGATAAVLDTGMSLKARCNVYIANNRLNRKEFAAKVNFSRSAIGQYLDGKYNSNPVNIEAAIRRFFASVGEEPQITVSPAKQTTTETSPAFVRTNDARNILGVCRACQEDNLIGVVTGQSGYGKTYALQQYAKLPNVVYVASNVFWGPRNMVKRLEQALGVTPPKVGSVDDHIEAIVEHLTNNPDTLLIIDEADKLITKYASQKLYMLQTIYDSAPVGIILAGLPKLAPQLAAYLPELENRAIYGCKLHGPNAGDVDEYLQPYNIEPGVLDELHGRAYGKSKSCFRLLARTLDAVLKDLKESQQDTITMDIYSRATSNMVIR